jgi:RNA polymerase sigma-70 factor (ECF subfamily)
MNKPSGNNAVAELFDAHSRALLLYARQWVGAAGAEDVVQRVFVRLVSSGRLPAEPRRWLFRCVRNEAISYRRSEDRRSRREQAVASEAKGWFVPDPGDRLDANDVQAALEALPPDQREVVVLRLWSGLTLSEIAGVTGAAVSTVHARYASAVTTLRQKLEYPCSNRKT